MWKDAGLDAIEAHEIVVQRTFVNFKDFWAISSSDSSISPTLATMDIGELELLKVRVRLAPDKAGRVVCNTRANAIKGCVRRRLSK